jgi:hypothetical protein
MTKEKSPQNLKNDSEKIVKLGKEYDFKITDSRVHGLIESLEEAKQYDDTHKAIEILEMALKQAKEERLSALNILKSNPNAVYTFSTNMVIMPEDLNAVIEKINEVLKDEEAADEEVVENEQENTSENTSEGVDIGIEASGYKSVSDSISDYLKTLKGLESRNNQISPEFK